MTKINLGKKEFVLEEYSPSCRKALHGNKNRKLADSTTSLFINMKCVCWGGGRWWQEVM